MVFTQKEQDILKIIELENEITRYRLMVLNQLREKISGTSMDGVRTTNSKMVVLDFSVLKSSGRINLSIEYYAPAYQAAAVFDYLSLSRSVVEMRDRLKSIAESGAIKTGNTLFRLNPKTIEVLKGSELYSA